MGAWGVGSFENDLGFTGRALDSNGLLYYRARFYDPRTGRFLTEDPIGRWQDRPNLGSGYAWISNRFRNAWDPLGLEHDRGSVAVAVDQLRELLLRERERPLVPEGDVPVDGDL